MTNTQQDRFPLLASYLSITAIVFFVLGQCGSASAAEAINGDSPAAIQAMLQSLQRKLPGSIEYSSGTGVTRLTLSSEYVTDAGLAALTNLTMLKELEILMPPRPAEPSLRGFSTLGALTNLHELTLRCGANLQPGVLDQVSRLRSLKALTVTGRSAVIVSAVCFPN